MFADDFTAEEELLLAAGEVENVSAKLRLRVLSAARTSLRRRQSRRELGWVAAGLLMWVTITQVKAAPKTIGRAMQVALASWRGDGGGRDEERGRVFADSGVQHGQSLRGASTVETWRLDDLMHGETARADRLVAQQSAAVHKLPALETMRSQWRELLG
jgi:hypothetical protein